MSFPSLGASLGASVGGTRRVTTRVRCEQSELYSTERGGTSSGGGAVTDWMHPEERKVLRRQQRQRRERESERRKDEAAQVSGGVSAPSALSPVVHRQRSRLVGAAPQLSSFLLAHFTLGKICTLRRKVGKVVHAGSVPSLSGFWVALTAYRPHGIGRRPVFDFDTVRHERQQGVLVAIGDTALAAMALRVPMGIGVENYDDAAWSTRCEVESHVLARAQREAMKLIGGAQGDHTVFVRVDEKSSDLSARLASHPTMINAPAASPPSTARDHHPPLLPALTSPRTGVGAVAASVAPSPLPTDRKKKRREKERDISSTTASPTITASAPESEPATALLTPIRTTEADAPAPVQVESSMTVPPLAKISPAAATPRSSVGLVLESEAQLPLLARKFHLSGPFAEVDALALTVPSSYAQSAYTLSKYLTARYPHTISNEEKKARVLFRWITGNIAMSRSPLVDRLKPGEKLQTEEASPAVAIAAQEAADQAVQDKRGAPSQAIDAGEMPSASALKRMSQDMQLAAQTELDFGTNAPTGTPTAALGGLTLNAKAQAFHRMDLGFGPSSKNGVRTKTKRRRGGARDSVEIAGVSSFGGGLEGYSSEEVDGAEDEFDDDAVEAVMKKNREAAAKRTTDAVPPVDHEATSAEGVLHARASTAYGFATLFQALAAIAGLECLVVRGLLKCGPEYRARTATAIPNLDGSVTTNLLPLPTDHSGPVTVYSDWNLVRIDERWYAIDCFAAAGLWDVNSASGGFVRRFSAAYFTPSPESLILNHFPLFAYRHTGVEHSSGPSGTGGGRRYRTVIGSSTSGAIQTLDRFGANASGDAAQQQQVGGLAGYTTKAPLAMSTVELLNQPRALQLLQPPVNKQEFDSYVNVSRYYVEYALETYESEFQIVYGVNALGGGVAGTTHAIELETPPWLEVGAELCALTNVSSSADTDDLLTDQSTADARRSSLRSPLSGTTGELLGSPKRGSHGRSPSFATSFVNQVSASETTASLMPPSILHPNSGSSSRVATPAESSVSLNNSSAVPSLYDLSTCVAVQKAVGTRLEVRQAAPAASVDGLPSSPAASTVQRHKKTLHRTRVKVHLVFPVSGKYRVVIFCKNPLDSHNGTSTSTDDAAPSTNPDAIGTTAESTANWQPLMEYSISVNQGVADLPKRKTMVVVLAKAPVVNVPGVAAVSPSPPIPILVTPPTRHLFVGFLQLHRPTFSVPSIRMVASQIVCVRPWFGYYDLSSSFNLQFVTPREVVELVVVSDGRWCPFNEGGQGLLATRYVTAQAELLSKVSTSMEQTLTPRDNEISMTVGDAKVKSKAPVLHYQQGQARNVYTLDWSMGQVPEMLIYFKVATKYFLLSYFLPSKRNYIQDLPAPLSKADARRLALTDPTPYKPAPAPCPLMASRFFLAPSGIAFEYQLHYRSSVVNQSSLVMQLDCLRDTELRARLVEGWVSGRASRTPNESIISERELASDSIVVEEVLEVAQDPRPNKNFASIPALLRPRAPVKPPSPSDDDGPLPNPLHQRMKVMATIPSTGSIQNTTNTRHFTLMLYVWSREQGKQDRDALALAAQTTSPRAAGGSTGKPPKMFRLALSWHIYAHDDQDREPPPPHQ